MIGIGLNICVVCSGVARMQLFYAHTLGKSLKILPSNVLEKGAIIKGKN